MEYYPHQQQQQTIQQVDSMATGSSIITTTTTTNSSSSNSNSNTTTTTTTNTNINNNIPPTNNLISTTSTTTVTADAATVAIAKDMLQLHHGSALSNNNSNTNNNSNGNGSGNNTSNSNNNNTATDANVNMSNTVLNAASDATAAANATAVATTTTTTNAPPAHTNVTAHNTNAGTAATTTAAGAAAATSDNALGSLKYEQELLYITESCTIIGRNSSTSHVHFHVAENNLVSRKHFQVVYDEELRDFYVQCLSKNGIFVDDFLQRRNADPLKLPARCFFRFPSTDIRINFESYLHDATNHGNTNALGNATTLHSNNHSPAGILHNNAIGGSSGANATGHGNAHVIISPAPPDHLQQQQQQQHTQQHPLSHHQQQQQQNQHQHVSTSATAATASHLLPMDSSNVIYSPLKISIPKKEQKSPYLSPTGTISAANSCPASPRQGFHQNPANYNNYSNNNLQNQDQFQTPLTASYNHNEKPPYSYAQLIVQAISAAPDKQLTLSGIYSFIVKHYPFYRKETNKGWQNSIRHNLSLNRYFIKVARSQDEPGKGSFWRIDPDIGAKLIDHSYKKRRQRSSQGFRPSYGMPRSAPVSPSHMDNSRESSPLQDIVLQSAPGSPGMSMENRAAEDLMYNSQNMHQSAASAAANNSHQYNSGSPYYASNQNTVIGIASGAQQQQQQSHGNENVVSSGNGVGALIALKRNHAMAAGAAAAAAVNVGQHQQQQQQQQQPLHPDIIYEESPTDYSGAIESGDDECDATTAAAKRTKYMSEVL